ncbi:hypothetical protein IWW48_004748 [Coemansia sp. RSA 1200]|nr:hypothetical protein IWW48_004748 [Coemansia sp. RSA 1200]
METRTQSIAAALNDENGNKRRTTRTWVWSNVVIMHTLVKYMEPQTRYGELVKALDLSMIYPHWDRILEMQRQNYVDTIIQLIASSCVNTKTLNLEMCKMLPAPSFVKLFADNSQLRNSLTELDLTHVEASDTEIEAFIRLFPKLERLSLGGTEADIVTRTTIAKCLPRLRFLDLSHSYEIDDECVRVIAKSCKDLRYLNIFNCRSIQTEDVSGMLEKLGASIHVSR